MTISIRRKDTNVEHAVDCDPSLPAAWTGPHISLRLAEAFTMLEVQDDDHTGACMRTMWPRQRYEPDDLVAQAEQRALDGADEGETLVREYTPRQNSNMVKALLWAVTYLPDRHELRIAVNGVAEAHSRGLGAEVLADRHGGSADAWRLRHDLGCELIARGLRRDRVAVF